MIWGQFRGKPSKNMKQLNKKGDNLGGLIRIWAIPFGVFNIAGNTIQITDQSGIFELNCTADSMEFSESGEVTPSGIHYNTEISGIIPQDNAALQEAIAILEPRRWIVIYMDGNGNYKLAGNNISPLRFTAEINTGKDTSSLAGCTIRFTGKTKTRAMFINNPF